MRFQMRKILSIIAASVLLCSCSAKKEEGISIGVFIPGILEGSPVYSMLAEGVKSAADEFNSKNGDFSGASVHVFQAGTNQAQWSDKLTALAAEGRYDVIISSNPSLPAIVEPISARFPSQKFILLDAELFGNKSVATVSYNQYEQAYLTGYIGGLMSESHRLALIAAQEYPVMDNIIFPYFKKGAEDAVPGSTAEFRIVGNWYDAAKAAEIADALIKTGTDVILPICGGAAQGVLTSAVNSGIYITWFDDNGFSKAPQNIISSTVMRQDRMASKMTDEFLAGGTKWGTAETVGVSDGFIEFVQDDEAYIKNVPPEIRKKMAQLVDAIKNGTLKVGK